jgi:hypothetical protein
LWLSGSGAKSFLNSTISGNASGSGGADVPGASSGHGGDGGGIWIGGTGAVTIALTTIADNETGVAGATAGGLGGGNIGAGGGAYHAGTATPVQINNSIIAGNRRGAASATASSDLAGPGSFATRYSLIGVSDGATLANNGGNKIGTVGSPLDAELDSLTDNGGVTLTHAILPGSPALDAGDPALAAGVGGTPTFDQRGEPYGRVFGARIDMGSFESLDEGEPSGDPDFDNDSDMDGNDFLLWQRGTGDADGDGDTDGADLSAWRQGYGSLLVLPSAAPLTSALVDSHATGITGGPFFEMLAGLEPAAGGSRVAQPTGNVPAREKFWGLIEQQRIRTPASVARSSPYDPLRESRVHRAQREAKARAAAFDDLSFSGLEPLGPI